MFRIIGGLGVGIASMTSPMYIAEIAPAKKRGQLVSLYQLAVVFGFFIVFLATYFIGGGESTTGTDEIINSVIDGKKKEYPYLLWEWDLFYSYE